jgi:hypothetical protein
MNQAMKYVFGVALSLVLAGEVVDAATWLNNVPAPAEAPLGESLAAN